MNAVVDRPEAGTGAGTMDETFVRFGPAGALTGILSGPPGADRVLLLPSAGLQPRSGPFRLHVLLARRMAARGLRTFRYDVPGVGEAPRLRDCDAVQASIAALDVLEAAHGCRSFAIGGICSAADTGWDVADADARISALLMLDGICFAGPWYHYARLLGLLRRLPREWRRFARKAGGRLRDGGGGLDALAFRSWPARAQARAQFGRFVGREVRMLWIYSGTYGEVFLHPAQFAWSFGASARDARVEMHFWPDCDHTYFGGAQRERLLEATTRWLQALPARRQR
jgi:hypothetical protein